MSELTKKINNFFRLATRKEVQEVKDKIYISEHFMIAKQEKNQMREFQI